MYSVQYSMDIIIINKEMFQFNPHSVWVQSGIDIQFLTLFETTKGAAFIVFLYY